MAATAAVGNDQVRGSEGWKKMFFWAELMTAAAALPQQQHADVQHMC